MLKIDPDVDVLFFNTSFKLVFRHVNVLVFSVVYIGFLPSLSLSFVVCGDFNIHVDSVSPLVSGFKSMVYGSYFISDHKIVSCLVDF